MNIVFKVLFFKSFIKNYKTLFIIKMLIYLEIWVILFFLEKKHIFLEIWVHFFLKKKIYFLI